MTTVTLTSASTSPWNCPAGVTSIEVQCWGEGGNGEGTTSPAQHGGGGGGEFAQELTVAVTSGSNYSFTIGSGGTGTDTVFTGDTQTVTAHHGASATSSTGAAGGTGSSNTTHFNGGSGGNGVTSGFGGGGGGGASAGTGAVGGNGSNAVTTTGGAGGTAPTGGGAGGHGGNQGAGGSAGTAPGGGGGGGGTDDAAGSGAGGQIIITYTASPTISGGATLTGSGTLSPGGALGGSASLSGSGSLSESPQVITGPTLSGSGTLQAAAIGTLNESQTFTGSGTITPAAIGTLYGHAGLSGSGALAAHDIQGYSLVLTGAGSLGNIATGGTVAASAGASTPQAFPGTSQVSVAAPGSSNWHYIGSIGLVTALTYSFVCPGGCDQMTCTVMVPATYRTQLFNPGWQVRVTRGGHVVWTGVLDEPVPTTSGWNLSAVGTGNLGANYVAVYNDTWPAGEPDEAVNLAIGRGLPWVNPGIGSPAGLWLGQAVDSGAQTVAALLNLCCTRGGMTWYVNSQPGGAIGASLSLFNLPTTVSRLLVCTQPVPRTLGGDINTIFIKYQISAASTSGSTSTPAQFGVTEVQNAQSVAMHGELETYIDLTSAGTITAGQAQAVGNYVLGIYQRASFAGPFTGNYGQLLNTGGVPIDPGTDQAGTVAKLILTDYGYGGEVTPQFPVTFIVGSYEWDDFAQQFTITPFQTLDESVTNLLSMENTVLTPITTQS
jgi:hypothetical protein